MSDSITLYGPSELYDMLRNGEISRGAVLLAMVINGLSNNQGNQYRACYATNQYLGKQMNLKPRQIRTLLHELKEANVVRVIRSEADPQHEKHNRYLRTAWTKARYDTTPGDGSNMSREVKSDHGAWQDFATGGGEISPRGGGEISPTDSSSSDSNKDTNPHVDETQNQSAPPTAPPDEEFEAFWDYYPARDGRKRDKGLARKQWDRLSKADRDKAIRAAPIYAREEKYVKDAFRWLRDRSFESWLVPKQPAKSRVLTHEELMNVKVSDLQ